MPPKKNGPKKSAKPADKPVPVDAIKHQDTRPNIPTRELQALAADHEDKIGRVLYPRDPSLDPQLVWKGKDQQDAADLEVPAPPIYIQEKVHPQAIIEDIRQRAATGKPRPVDLFSDFNGLEESKRTEFYQHPQHWSNRMILGDSLMVMASLAEKEHLRGRVQMVYIDPPYGIKFGSNWQVSTRKRDVKDGKLTDLTGEREVIRAFRDTWEYGIHSYLKVWRDRLTTARDLLTESGSIFVQIGDENVHLVRCLMDEVFGSENLVSQIMFKKTAGQTTRYLSGTADYLLWYARDYDRLKFRPLFIEKKLGGDDAYVWVELPDGKRRRITDEERRNPKSLPPNARPFTSQLLQSQRQGRPSGPGSAMYFPVEFEGRTFHPTGNRGWTTTRDGMTRLRWADRFLLQGNSIRYLRYLNDFPATEITDMWNDTQSGSAMDRYYVVQTTNEVAG
jgi:adenine-specific DNA-methyltransferase